jgi:hypothetical protein
MPPHLALRTQSRGRARSQNYQPQQRLTPSQNKNIWSYSKNEKSYKSFAQWIAQSIDLLVFLVRSFQPTIFNQAGHLNFSSVLPGQDRQKLIFAAS